MADGIPIRLRQTVYEAARGHCAYCHSRDSLMGVTFEVDHILPRSKGGTTNQGNLCLACPTCNRYKSAKTEALDPETNQTVPLFDPVKDAWDEHFIWSEKGSVLIGLSSTSRATVEWLRMNRPVLIQLRLYWVATLRHTPIDDPRR